MGSLIEKLKTINRFLTTFRVSKRLLVFITILMVISAIGNTFSAGLIIPFLNSLQNVEVSDEAGKVVQFFEQFFLGIPATDRFVYMLFTILAIMSAVQFLMVVMNRLSMRFCMFELQYNVANILFKEILNARLKFFYKQNTGALINNLVTDVNRAHNCVHYLLKMIAPILFMCAFIAISFLIMPVYTTGLMMAIAGAFLLFRKILPFLYALGEKNRIVTQDTNNMILQTLQGIRTVILSCAQKVHEKHFRKMTEAYYTTFFHSYFISHSLPPVVNFLGLVVITLVFFLNRHHLLEGNQAYFSQMAFFVYIVGNIFLQAGKINSMYSSFAFCYRGVQALLQLDEDLKKAKAEKPVGTLKINNFQKEIAVRDLLFEYNRDVPVLRNLNFTIPSHQKVAFVGSSGSGKSTLVDVLSGFHDDYTGSIQIDGRELREIDKDDWRHLVGYVSQETFIFNDTIRNNLLFGFTREINDAELAAACQKAQIYETIMSFPKQFDTPLGERGIRLSGGEKQRLAIARLFLKNPPLVFLDEATSSLDSESEKKVKDALEVLSQGRTVVAVAHRLSTIADFDQIYVLEKGMIVEFGSHERLIAQRGAYYRYYTIQSLDKEVEEKDAAVV